jgi:hypothetical protein
VKKVLVVAALSVAVTAFSVQLGRTKGEEEWLDLEPLLNGPESWEVISSETEEGVKTVKLHHGRWLMFFLHWRPLTEDRQKLNRKYVRDLLLSLWGPNMPFKITKRGGKLNIGDHQGFWVEGVLERPGVRTRFLVWNCPETNRQLIADTNINVAMGTDDNLLVLQEEIAKTVCCHGVPTEHRNKALTQEHQLDEYGVSLTTPSTWRTRSFIHSKWYPEGMTRENGSLWSLLTDSEKHIEVMQRSDSREPSAELLEEYLSQMTTPMQRPEGVVMEIKNIKTQGVTQSDASVTADGLFTMRTTAGQRTGDERYLFRAVLKKDGPVNTLLFAGMIAHTHVWGVANDLKPEAVVFDDFVEGQAIPVVMAWQR